MITEPCEACSVQQLNNVKFVQLFNHWTVWSGFSSCTTFFYTHCTDMSTDADEVEHMTVDVGDEDHHHQWCNGNDERNWFGVRYLQLVIVS